MITIACLYDVISVFFIARGIRVQIFIHSSLLSRTLVIVLFGKLALNEFEVVLRVDMFLSIFIQRLEVILWVAEKDHLSSAAPSKSICLWVRHKEFFV